MSDLPNPIPSNYAPAPEPPATTKEALERAIDDIEKAVLLRPHERPVGECGFMGHRRFVSHPSGQYLLIAVAIHQFLAKPNEPLPDAVKETI